MEGFGYIFGEDGKLKEADNHLLEFIIKRDTPLTGVFQQMVYRCGAKLKTPWPYKLEDGNYKLFFRSDIVAKAAAEEINKVLRSYKKEGRDNLQVHVYVSGVWDIRVKEDPVFDKLNEFCDGKSTINLRYIISPNIFYTEGLPLEMGEKPETPPRIAEKVVINVLIPKDEPQEPGFDSLLDELEQIVGKHKVMQLAT